MFSWTNHIETTKIFSVQSSPICQFSNNDGIWLVWYFLNKIVMNETFSVIFHLPDYKTIGNTMQHQKSH